MRGRQGAIRLGIGLVVVAAFAVLASGPARRVGDGSEYYALELAWRETWRPFMTERAWAAYEALRTSGDVAGLSDRAFLERAYGWIAVHDAGATTLDFNHFWFESALAALASTLLRALAVSASPHAGFLGLHALLLVALFDRSYRAQALPGLLATCTLLFATPALWFVDKAHTELFTFALTTYAVVAFWDRRPGASGVALALASTQNPSFALPALVAAALDVRRGPRRPALARAAVVLATSLLHPAYYLVRLGTPTPQLHSGGAAPLANLRHAWVYLLDLDVGLLGHAAPVLLLAVLGLRARGPATRERPARVVFVAAYVLSCVAAHASTTNLNSGGTPGIGRYALWYLALLHPPLVALFRAAREHEDLRARRALRSVAVVTALAGLAVTFARARPSEDESCGRPTYLSRLVQERAPWLYDPAPEIFAERWGGVGEDTQGVAVVLGPDCHKALVLAPPGTGRVLSPPGCLVLRAEPPRVDLHAAALPAYGRLVATEDEDLAIARRREGTWFDATSTGALEGWRGGGFSQPEPWATWTDGPSATLYLPCLPGTESVADLDLVPFTGPSRPKVHARLELAGGEPEASRDVELSAREVVRLVVPATACDHGVTSVVLLPREPVAPAALGLSDDHRALGVALVRFRTARRSPQPASASLTR